MRVIWAGILAMCWLGGQTSVDRRSFTGVRELVLDNVNGEVEIAAEPGDRVEMEATREIHASTADGRVRAEREVKLEVEQQGGRLRLYVDGPFRCNCREWHSPGYEVSYRFRLRVPASASVDAHTVNGGITARYARNPSARVALETINGGVETTFAGGLGADVLAKTMNGAVYSDFEVSAAPGRVTVERVGNMTRYRREGMSFRIGAGGPALELRTLNGDVIIRSK